MFLIEMEVICLRRKKSNVVKYRQPIRFNIGIIIFLFIFIYMIVIMMSFFNRKKVSIYEVTEKKIADDNTCQGVIIREETLVKSPMDGYVNYFTGNGSRVAVGNTILSIDADGNLNQILSGAESKTKITAEECENIRTSIGAFKKNYSDSNYQQVTTFQYDMSNAVMELMTSNMLENLETLANESNTKQALKIVKSKKSGIVSYSMDGLEGLKGDDVSLETFNTENYKRTQLRTTEKVESGTITYKLITNENWSIVLSLSKEQYEKLHEIELERQKKNYTKGYVTITFTKNGLETGVNYTTFQKGDGYFATLDLSKYMVHYINDRFIEVELSLNSARGLKIPKSSILEKTFLKVPLSCFTKQEETNTTGLLKQTYTEKGETTNVFVAADIFYSDDKYAYIDVEEIRLNDILYNPKTKKTYEISKTDTLEGVFNVNKGYAIFRRIEKVYENEEYCIVKKGTSYGLSAYDHIVVDATSIQEQEILTKQ